MSQQVPQPPPYYPYPYWQVPQAPVVVPKQVFPVPPARIVPLAWAVTLTIGTAVAIALAFIAPSLNTPAPAGGSVFYASKLTAADSNWQTSVSSRGTCAFMSDGLHSTSTQPSGQTSASLSGFCGYTGTKLTDFTMKVTLLPAATLNATQRSAIIINTNVAFVIAADGIVRIGNYNSVQNQYETVKSLSSNEWHTLPTSRNVITIRVLGPVYTLGINGVQVFSQVIDTNAGTTSNYALLLGTDTTATITATEAGYTDLSISTP